MPNNIDPEAQAKRRRGAWQSVITATLWLLLSGSVLLYLRQHYVSQGIVRAVMLTVALLEYGMIIPVWILLKTRLKEIEGGEEDAAAEY